jgi:hypothetical protein
MAGVKTWKPCDTIPENWSERQDSNLHILGSKPRRLPFLVTLLQKGRG